MFTFAYSSKTPKTLCNTIVKTFFVRLSNSGNARYHMFCTCTATLCFAIHMLTQIHSWKTPYAPQKVSLFNFASLPFPWCADPSHISLRSWVLTTEEDVALYEQAVQSLIANLQNLQICSCLNWKQSHSSSVVYNWVHKRLYLSIFFIMLVTGSNWLVLWTPSHHGHFPRIL